MFWNIFCVFGSEQSGPYAPRKHNSISPRVKKQPYFHRYHPVSVCIVTLPDSSLVPITCEQITLKVKTKEGPRLLTMSMPSIWSYEPYTHDEPLMFDARTCFNVRRLDLKSNRSRILQQQLKHNVYFGNNPVVEVIFPTGTLFYKCHQNELWVFVCETDVEAEVGMAAGMDVNDNNEEWNNYVNNATTEQDQQQQQVDGLLVRTLNKCSFRGHKATLAEEYLNSQL